MREISSLTFFVSVLVLGLPAMAGEPCERYSIETPPSWVSSVAYDSPRNRVLMADPGSSTLFAFDPSSGDLLALNRQGSGSQLHFDVKQITQVGDEHWVSIGNGQTLRLDSDLRVKASFIMPSPASTIASELASLHSRWIASDGMFLGFGAVRGGNTPITDRVPDHIARGYDLGFVLGSLSPEGDFKNPKLVRSFESDKNVFYRLGLPYFAATKAGLFFVEIQTDDTRLWWVEPSTGSRAMHLTELTETIPGRYRRPGPIGAGETPSFANISAIYNSMPRMTMISGLIGHLDQLFLLTREPSVAGQTLWALVPVDPRSPRKPSPPLHLPTTAPHIEIVPGDPDWFIIEKGEVASWGKQDVSSFVKIPGNWFAFAGETPALQPLNCISYQRATIPR